MAFDVPVDLIKAACFHGVDNKTQPYKRYLRGESQLNETQIRNLLLALNRSGKFDEHVTFESLPLIKTDFDFKYKPAL